MSDYYANKCRKKYHHQISKLLLESFSKEFFNIDKAVSFWCSRFVDLAKWRWLHCLEEVVGSWDPKIPEVPSMCMRAMARGLVGWSHSADAFTTPISWCSASAPFAKDHIKYYYMRNVIPLRLRLQTTEKV